MHANYEWSEYNEQPGLFTLYFQDKTYIPTSRDGQEFPSLKIQAKRRFKSQSKISSKYRRKTWGKPILTPAKPLSNEKQPVLTMRETNFKKIKPEPKVQTSTPPQDAQKRTTTVTKVFKSQLKLKVNNINKNVDFDLARSNSKTIYYEERPVPYIRALSKKLSKLSIKPQKANTSLTTSYNQQPQPQPDLKKSTNSDAPPRPVLHNKTPFLDILLKPTPKQSSLTLQNRHKLTLSHLITFNNPAYYKQHYRIKTQR